MADQISLGEADDDDATDVTDDSALNTPLPDNRETVAFFDPLQPQDVRCDVTTGRRCVSCFNAPFHVADV